MGRIIQRMEPRYILGADPGKHGAIVLIDKDDRSDVIMIPTKVASGVVDVDAMWDALLPYRDKILFGAVEQVHAIFGSMASGTFNFGDAFGSLRSTIQLFSSRASGNKFRVITVAPKVWQSIAWAGIEPVKGAPVKSRTTGRPKLLRSGEVQCKVDTKATSSKAAATRFPGVSFVPERCRTEHDGCVDAALIAYYGSVYYGRISRR